MDEVDPAEPSSIARWFAIVPVLVIGGGFIAFMLGYDLGGPTYKAPEWRTHTIEQQHFAVATPGVFVVNQQSMSLNGQDVPAQVYIAYDLGVDFSVTVVRRPDGDVRPFNEAAKGLGLMGTDGTERPDGGTAFRHDVDQDGTRTQAVLIFRDRTMYQLMVTAPTGSFPVIEAERFFSSFRFLANS